MDKIIDLDKKFLATVELVQALPATGVVTPETDLRLQMYALYKVATVGKNDKPKPPIWRIEERLKWAAWKNVENMDPKRAKYKYMQLFGERIKKIFYSGQSEQLLRRADMSFLKQVSNEALQVLFDGVMDSDEAEQDIKTEMVRLRKIYLP